MSVIFLSCLSFVLEWYQFWYWINNLTNISVSKTGLCAFNLFIFFLQQVYAALHSNPGSSDILKEYEQTKSLSDKTRKKLVNIVVADMVEKYG